MCVIIVAPTRFPCHNVIKAAASCNSHGAGIAFLKDGKVKFSKGNLTPEEIIAFEAISNPPYLIHFRLATQGGQKPELAHPFPVSLTHMDDLEGVANMVLAHNGTWGEEKWRNFVVKSAKQDQKTREFNMPSGPWSDSKAIAWLYSIYGSFFLEHLNEKVATLDPKFKLKMYGNGWTKKGYYWDNNQNDSHDFWFSNLNWEKRWKELQEADKTDKEKEKQGSNK